MLKARVNTQHEYITLRVENGKEAERINLTGSFSGEKASYRGLDSTTINRLLKAFSRAINGKGAPLKRRFADFTVLAERSMSFIEFAGFLENYVIPPEEPEAR
jgi:hypothetical protein